MVRHHRIRAEVKILVRAFCVSAVNLVYTPSSHAMAISNATAIATRAVEFPCVNVSPSDPDGVCSSEAVVSPADTRESGVFETANSPRGDATFVGSQQASAPANALAQSEASRSATATGPGAFANGTAVSSINVKLGTGVANEFDRFTATFG